MKARANRIENATRSNTACEQVVLADNPFSRLRGLLGRRELPVGQGLLLTPAPSIHTSFMRFAIDAVFLDKDLQVLRIVERLKPWRVAFQRGARSVLELPAGEVARVGVRVGDRLTLVEPLASMQATHRGSEELEGDHTSAMLARQRATRRALALAQGKPTEAQPSEIEGQRERLMHVMVVSSDRRFREVASLLFTRRGCAVSLGEGTGALAERIDRNHTEVVLIDAERSLAAAARMAAAVQALSRPVGIVVVNNQPEHGLHNLQTVPKWDSFEVLFTAVEQAHAGRADRRPLFEHTVNGGPS